VTPRPPCTGVILAGGRASRYGGLPKGLERVGGERIIDRVAARLAQVSDELLLIANVPDATTWLPNVRLERDVITDAGSLGGIHAALAHAGRHVLLLPWDMPFVPVPLLQRLRDFAADADAVVPESGSRRGLEPLCACYAPACLPVIERRLRDGDRRVVSFFEDVRLQRIPSEEVRRFGDPDVMFMNVNSPDELALANAHDAADRHHRRTQE
jgi:molybdenum cofactor guanylyltransferase